jgi:hypothetical protein
VPATKQASFDPGKTKNSVTISDLQYESTGLLPLASFYGP